MMGNITQEVTRPQPSDSYAGQILISVKRNFGRCLQAIKAAPPTSTKLSEILLVLSVPLLAMLMAFLPIVMPLPATRFLCASGLAFMLAIFVGHRLIIVQSMSTEQTYSLTGALMGTFLFGLTVAVICSECLGMIGH